MDSATLELLKAHGKIDHDDDDSLLRFYYGAAVEYLADNGITESKTSLYLLTAFTIALEWYDGVPVGTVTLNAQSLINHFKLNVVAESEDPAF